MLASEVVCTNLYNIRSLNPPLTSPDTNIMQFPPITKSMALGIAQHACNVQDLKFDCYSNKPERCCILYGINPDEPCWYVMGAWNDNPNVLRSSRLVVISRVTGAILYDGSAGDEG